MSLQVRQISAREREWCPHADRPWRCPTCCLADLRRNLSSLQAAVAGARRRGAGGDFVSGGAPSWEPINVAALALLQDIRANGGLNQLEQTLANNSPDLRDAQRQVRQWASRAALILGQALAPYQLRWDMPTITVWRNRWTWVSASVPVPCPVIDENGACAADLRVHREQDPARDDYATPRDIVCAHHEDHAWSRSNGGWLRLGVLLGGIA